MSDNPTEPFKQALAETARTIAGDSELEITYSADPSGMSGRRMRLPQISRRMQKAEIALARGQADAMALRLRHHDATTFNGRLPQGEMARQILSLIHI